MNTADRYDLNRYRAAQNGGDYERALAEVRGGRKRSHWIWYIFPQIKGLPGSSYNSRYYAVSCVDEAREYIKDPLLGGRLREISQAILDCGVADIEKIFGDVDTLKVRSCMTLFDYVSPDDVFAKVLDTMYGGSRCPLTVSIIKAGEERLKTPETACYPAGKRYTPERISRLEPGEVFVFGSNLGGRHYGGAARAAVQYFGAIMGQGVGLQGQSYAIPTMQGGVETIKPYVDDFIAFAASHPELKFLVTPIGCGIAGFMPRQIAPLFEAALPLANVLLPRTFVTVLCGGADA